MEPRHRPLASKGCALACSLLVAALAAKGSDEASIEVAEFGLVGGNSLPVPSFTLPAHAPADPPARHRLEFEIGGSPAGVDFADAFQRAIPLAAPTLTIKHTVPGPVPETFRVIAMENATVEAIATTSAGGNPPVADRITLGFDRYTITHTESPAQRDSVFFDCPQRTFARVTDGGAPPRIAPIGPQSTTEGQVLTVGISLSDADTPVASLSLRAEFSHTPVLPAGSVQFDPPAANSSATLSPAPGVAGSAFVTLIASDGANEGAATFLLTVAPNSGSAPTDIVLSAASVAETVADGEIIASITVDDPDVGDTHSLTLTDDAGGRFALAGTDLVATDGSLFDFEVASSHEIAITAVDSTGNAFAKTFVIAVIDVAEGAFDAWRAAHFSPAQLADIAISGLLADPDRDGSVNLIEFGSGSLPLDGNSLPPPAQIRQVDVGGQTHSTLTWRQLKATVDPRLEVYPQRSDAPPQWGEGALAFAPVSAADIPGTDFQEITVRALAPRPAGGGELFRIRFRRTDP